MNPLAKSRRSSTGIILSAAWGEIGVQSALLDVLPTSPADVLLVCVLGLRTNAVMCVWCAGVGGAAAAAGPSRCKAAFALMCWLHSFFVAAAEKIHRVCLRRRGFGFRCTRRRLLWLRVSVSCSLELRRRPCIVRWDRSAARAALFSHSAFRISLSAQKRRGTDTHAI